MLDLTRRCYSEWTDLAEELRRSDALRDLVAFEPAHEEGRGHFDAHEMARCRIAHLLLLQQEPCDLTLSRWLLDQEIAAREADSFQGAGDALVILSLLVMESGDLADCRRFWAAKRANFDTWAGGYDTQFVFAMGGPQATLDHLENHLDAEEFERVSTMDTSAIVDDLPRWRASMERRYARSMEAMTLDQAEAWAELFGDREGLEAVGLMNAGTPHARASLYRRLGRFDVSVTHWQQAASLAETPWDTVSLLRDWLVDAAKAGLPALEPALQIDALRHEVEGWSRVGLGRMCTQACYELALAQEELQAGRRLFGIAQQWRGTLRDLPLVGLEAGLAAARKWGSAAETEALAEAVRIEAARIEALLSSL